MDQGVDKLSNLSNMAALIPKTAFGFDTEGLAVAAAFSSAIKGRTILITGVNRKGIGYSTAESFASQSPQTLILAGRSPEKLQECIDDLKSTYPTIDYRPLKIDLSSQTSVRAAASEVLSWTDVPTIDLLINNAGIMNIQTRTITFDGVELTMATNHVGHFLLTNLILPKLIAATKTHPQEKENPVRIINLASMGINVSGIRFSDLLYSNPTTSLPEDELPALKMMQAYGLPVTESTTYFPTIAYGASKTAAVLFSVALNDLLLAKYGILSLGVNPGEIKTELGRNTDPEMLAMMVEKAESYGLRWKSLQQGCSTSMVAAVGDVVGEDGEVGPFWSDCQLKGAPGYATSREKARRLWEVSEGWVGERFEW